MGKDGHNINVAVKKEKYSGCKGPLPLHHCLVILPPGEEETEDLGAQMARHTMVWIAVILDDL